MLLGSFWTGKKEDEDNVTVAETAQVTAFLRAGTSTVVDATHLNASHLRKWARLATRLGVDFNVVDVHADIAECKRRDHARMLAGGRYVGDKVIDRQARQYPVHKWPTITAEPFTVEPVEWIEGLPEAIIVDLDGTLFHMVEGGRSPYDYDRVDEDVIDEAIRGIVADYARRGGYVLIVSGRDHTCREKSKRAMWDNDVFFHEFFMRDANDRDERGNKLPDYIVKARIFDAHIRGRYNIRFVLDDRTQVVDHCWRAMGLKCLQVAPGDF
jgi:predicted kinase